MCKTSFKPTDEDVSKLYGCHHKTLYDWIRFYEQYGKKGLLPRKNTTYILPFKLKVMKAINKDLLSFNQACLAFNIPTKSVVMNWHHNYKKEGIVGLNHK